ncbi:MAG: TadE/TadG family type IV pilus assembly protein [Pacificimonas sp.]|nr:TadE/TadG family type IV pilus assembly protein [Pacificimonas sp.]
MPGRIRGFCERLARDSRGNAVAIITAGLFPLMAAIGGGVDLTRAYMAEARLSQTCDAAALAGRKVMRETANDTGLGTTTYSIDSAGYQEINKFVAYNFPVGMFDTNGVTVTDNIAPDGELQLTLQTNVPSTIGRIVGVQSMPITVDCAAKRSGVNVDVAIAVDVTGSMGWTLDGSSSCSGSDCRITELQDALHSFLGVMDELRDQVAVGGQRVRVSIIPYNTTANIGRLLHDDDPTYIDDSGVYYATNNLGTFTTSTQVVCVEWFWWFCTRSETQTTTTWAQDGADIGEVGLDLSDFVAKGVANGLHPLDPLGYVDDNPYEWRGCVEMRTTVTDKPSQAGWVLADAYDVNGLEPGGGVPAWQPFFNVPQSGNTYGQPTGSQVDYGIAANDIWNFTPSTTATAATASRVPYNFNSAGAVTGGNTANGTYQGDRMGTDGPNKTCPDSVIPLDEWTQADLSDPSGASAAYVQNLQVRGSTYHDVGMYWALELLSTSAPFANQDNFAGLAVNKYVIFMTDGDLAPRPDIYTAFGIEESPTSQNNHTITSGNSINEHRERFELLCSTAKANSIEIYTIAFSSSITATDRTSLQGCASSPEHYKPASAAGELEAAFTSIAQNIGYLRVSQ